ncbi:type VII secretion protein EccB [Kitasatospora sp. NPDC049285]|uniref:type VII secretion protein EccB n=1 Tax=Kitasatospora sp. NPDC049285 TaxID=3157096 RepID=UPI003416A61B
MQSRRDQVQAHLFVMSRLAAGMLRAEPDAPDIPTGRTTRGVRNGLFIGVGIALIMGLYGVIVPGGATGWRKPGTLIVVTETGARFLYLGGELHPVLNQASAKLIAGEKMVLTDVREKSLGDTPRGGAVGILGAPDALPSAKSLSGDGWLACAARETTPSGSTAPGLALVIAPDRDGNPLTATDGVLIATPDGTPYLLRQGKRHKLDTANGAPRALGYSGTTPYPVTTAFLNALPVGADLAPPDVPGRGTDGPSLAGRPTRIGQLFTGPAGEHYLLGQGGLEQITATVFELLRGDPRTQSSAYGNTPALALPIGAADLADHPPVATAHGTDLPAEPPKLLNPAQGQSICAELRPAAAGPITLVTVVDTAALGGRAPSREPGILPTCTEADRIAVRPGGGALVRALSGGGTGATDYLVTDNGVKYPLPNKDAEKKLGYAGAIPVGVPDTLLTLLPTGPSLDPAALANGGVVSRLAPADACTPVKGG